MSVTGNLKSTTNNFNLSSRWINGKANGSDFKLVPIENSDSGYPTLTNTSVCSSASFFDDYRDKVNLVYYKNYDSGIYYYNGSSSKIFTSTILEVDKFNCHIIFSGQLKTNDNWGYVIVAGDKNRVLMLQTENYGGASLDDYIDLYEGNSLFEGLRGTVVCTYNQVTKDRYDNIGYYIWAIYKDSNNYLALMSPQDSSEWNTDINVKVRTYIQLDSTETIVNTPYFDTQSPTVSKIYVLTKSTYNYNLYRINLYSDNSVTANKIYSFGNSLIPIATDMMLTSVTQDGYYTGIIFNTIINGQLQWKKMSFKQPENPTLDEQQSGFNASRQPIISIGNDFNLIYNYNRMSQKGVEYVQGGLLNIIGSSGDYSNGRVDAHYYLFYDYFTNEDTVTVYCKQNDKVWLSTDEIWVLEPFLDYRYKDIIIAKLVSLNLIRNFPLVTSYTATKDCVVCVESSKLYGVELATPTN